MKDVNLKRTEVNPLAELSELRLDFETHDDKLDLKCRLCFATMLYSYKESQFEVGIKQAFLRLLLEGCETAIEPVYGDAPLSPVVQESTLDQRKALGGGLGCDVLSSEPLSFATSAHAEVLAERKSRQSKVLLPVRSRPNNCWEVQSVSMPHDPDTVIDGTAISGDTICSIKRKNGGNRLSIVGEVQVAKNRISVRATGGNRMGRKMSEWANKDAVVAQLLKRALQREAVRNNGSDGEFVAVSRCEIVEE